MGSRDLLADRVNKAVLCDLELKAVVQRRIAELAGAPPRR
jgi:hypothetical protein